VINLPPPDTRRLAQAPLALVVCQLRFGDPLAIDDPRVGTGLRDLVRDLIGDDVELERATAPDFVIAISSGEEAPPSREVPGFRVTHPSLTVSLGPGAVAIETTDYSEWAEFSMWFARIVEFVSETLNPPAEGRLGLRMINRLHKPELREPADFRSWIREWLLMPVVEEPISGGVVGFQQQCDLRAAGDLRITLRSALFPDRDQGGRLTFLLDYDAYRTGYRVFDAKDITQAASALNSLILQVFQHSITPDCYEEHANGTAAG
jgi:uncharacterized protein (TIGR04255 family)